MTELKQGMEGILISCLKLWSCLIGACTIFIEYMTENKLKVYQGHFKMGSSGISSLCFMVI